jgi:hypothetical protein
MKTEPFSSGRLHPKIADEHLARLAYIYVRQSSQKQVMQNKESQVNQYLLVERAEQLGWNAEHGSGAIRQRKRFSKWIPGVGGRSLPGACGDRLWL